MKKMKSAVLGVLLAFFMVGCASLNPFGDDPEKAAQMKFMVQETIGLAVDVASIKYPLETQAALVIVKTALDTAETALQTQQMPISELSKLLAAKIPGDKAGLYAKIILRRLAPLVNRFALSDDGIIDKEKGLKIIAFARAALGAY